DRARPSGGARGGDPRPFRPARPACADAFRLHPRHRYRGQAFEAPVELSADVLATLDADGLEARFRQAHRQLYAFAKAKGEAAEIVAYRAGGALPPPAFPAAPLDRAAGGETAVELFERGETRQAAMLPRTALPADGRSGPLLVDDGFATVFVPTGWRARLDPAGNIVIGKEA
ncbi:MAG: hypothetical protein RIM80_07030, partial [Alphaproteobacteria bacterium]